MRFLRWQDLLHALDAFDPSVLNDASDEAEAVVGRIEGVVLRVAVRRGEQVGNGLFKGVTVERAMPGEGWTPTALNDLNRNSPAISRLFPDRLSRFVLVAAGDLLTEADLRHFAFEILGDGSTKTAERDVPALVAARLSDTIGIVDHFEDFVRQAPVDRDVVCASEDGETGALHLNVLMSEGFVEDAAVHDLCAHLVSADFYDPHYQSTANRDVDDAITQSRTLAYQLSYAADWNRVHGLAYWRLRACVLAGRLVFRMPVLPPSGDRPDYSREINGMRRILDHQFHHRARVFHPIGRPGPISMLGRDLTFHLLSRALFGASA